MGSAQPAISSQSSSWSLRTARSAGDPSEIRPLLSRPIASEASPVRLLSHAEPHSGLCPEDRAASDMASLASPAASSRLLQAAPSLPRRTRTPESRSDWVSAIPLASLRLAQGHVTAEAPEAASMPASPSWRCMQCASRVRLPRKPLLRR